MVFLAEAMPISQSFSCSAPNKMTARQDWTLNGEGECLIAWLTINSMRSSGIGDFFERLRTERRILMASRNDVRYADAMLRIN